MFENVVVAGYGGTEYHQSSGDQRHALEYLSDSIRLALDDADIRVSEVDGLVHPRPGQHGITCPSFRS